MNENHLAIVLRSADYKDNDKMLTLLTAKKGKISALARGIRKQSSTMFGTADIFCCSEFGFYIKNERYIVTQSLLKKSFYNIREDFKRLITASAIIEIVETVSTEEQESSRLFALLAASLYALDNRKNEESIFLFFCIKLLDILGMRPETDKCVLCGKRGCNKINIYKGGVVCENCVGEFVNEDFLKHIKNILSTPSKNMSGQEYDIDLKAIDLASRWICGEIGKTPKSVKIMLDTFNDTI